MIPYGRQSISDDDIEAVVRVLRSDWLTTGPNVKEFEDKVARYCGARHAVAVNSATSALHIACLAAGLAPGDTLWTSPNTFIASANAALYCGAEVDFVDIDPRTYNISVACLESKLAAAEKAGKLPKAVVPVDFAGQSCEMEQIRALADRYGFTVIEDAAHAIGGRYGERKTGDCAYADMTVFSFHPVKVITTGEGGMVLTNNDELYGRLARLRSHGITRDPAEMSGGSDGPWYYQQLDLGYNYRMTDLQAALGSSQMDRIDQFVARRREIAARYTREFASLPVITPYQRPETRSAWHLYVLCLDPARTAKSRSEVFARLVALGIGVNVHYIPVHTQPYFRRRFGFQPNICPNALAYYDACLSLPIFPGLTDDMQTHVIASVKEALR
ncbi:UDP-4-amino-4,6-dideoxy-N-acetyl-beta-L-altrosamine transaminase [Anaeroselena agilis]|uniref:UDP-4-amino-4, 6-dideoxy-N-acetyl-beta-L-altrosamine transaminase n=1 Tax=Anaeroselena agilis TaxID=3063788 RepID=A0ABU3P4F8_9FIRM|nr:UDP-4-amino-4,6-dideoxy-N-acetyl-beta-L-altrosamine transaminase [Selenomonadales bacterium 4137-cl]